MANNLSSIDYQIDIISLSRQDHFYKLNPSVRVFEPHFEIHQIFRIKFIWRLFWWLREIIKSNKSNAYLSFGGKYNSFVLLAAYGFNKRIFVSERSRPGISYGKMLDIINPIIYKTANGIIAQTTLAKQYLENQYSHENIKIIPNPISLPHRKGLKKRFQILNVGRFIKSKHQDWLVNYFLNINCPGWELIFLGDGKEKKFVEVISSSSPQSGYIHFKGNVNEIQNYYEEAGIFAFTSTSEGFPNALAEAMAHGCACISFESVALPSGLIENGINGFLIPDEDHKMYIDKLKLLINNEELRNKFGNAAISQMKKFDSKTVSLEYANFLLK